MKSGLKLQQWLKAIAFFPKSKTMALCAAIVFLSFMETLGVVSILPFLKLASEPNLILENKYTSDIFHFFNFKSNHEFLVYLGLGFIVFFAVKTAAVIYLTYWKAKFWREADAKLGSRLLLSYLKRPYKKSAQYHTADLYRILTYDVSQTTGGIAQLLQALMEFSLIAFILSALVWLSPTLSLLATGSLGFIVGVIYLSVQSKTNDLARVSQPQASHQIKLAQQTLQGLKEIKIFGGEEDFATEYETAAKKTGKTLTLLEVISLLPKHVLESLLFILAIGASMYLLVFQSGSSLLSFSLIATYAAAAFKVIPALNRFLTAMINIKRAIPSLETVLNEFSMIEKEDYSEKNLDNTHTFTDKISIQNLTFSYIEDKPILKGVSIDIKKGQFIGIAGGSGAGKTTFIDLLLGLLSPTSGEISIDGKDISKLNFYHYRSLFGYVPQDIFLLDDSLKNNVEFRFKGQTNEERLQTAIQKANLKHWIDTLAGGTESSIGERGSNISGGQIQRIGIARALFRDPEILVLDEATSALDGLTESDLMSTIQSLRGEKTIILIAHRLSTLQKCDEILYFKNGSIQNKGTHQELISHSQDYQKLCESLGMIH